MDFTMGKNLKKNEIFFLAEKSSYIVLEYTKIRVGIDLSNSKNHCFVLEHFPMLCHILRIFLRKNWSVVNKLPLQPGKSKFDTFLVFCSFAEKS